MALVLDTVHDAIPEQTPYVIELELGPKDTDLEEPGTNDVEVDVEPDGVVHLEEVPAQQGSQQW